MNKFGFEEFLVEQKVVIIGGGLAGIIASIELSKFFPVYLIEKEKELGGNLINVDRVFTEGHIIKNPILNLIDFLYSQYNIDINLNAEITDIQGDPGKYTIKLTNGNQIKEIKAGAICICIGLHEEGIVYDDLKSGKIVNQTLFAQLLKKLDFTSKKLILFINNLDKFENSTKITGESANIYSLVNAIEAKKRDNDVFYIYDNINTTFMAENLYRKARESGIQFIMGYHEIENDTVKVKNYVDELTFNPDLIVLSNPLILNDNENIIKLLTEIEKNELGYLSTIYNKIYQNETLQKGIFIAGSCLHPMTISETVQHSRAASLSIYNFLRTGKLKLENSWSEIKDDKCINCKNCIHVCPFNAIQVIEDSNTNESNVKINKIRCRGCGICSSVCPTNAILVKKNSDDDLESNIQSIIKGHDKDPLIIGYICSQCASFSMKITEILKIQQDPNLFLLPVTCAGKLSPLNIIKPLNLGAKGVLILKCPENSCHFIDGSIKSSNIILFSRELLKSVNANPNQIQYIDIISTNYPKIKEKIDNFIESLR